MTTGTASQKVEFRACLGCGRLPRDRRHGNTAPHRVGRGHYRRRPKALSSQRTRRGFARDTSELEKHLGPAIAELIPADG